MRAAILGLAATLMAGQASAADYLRGSSWEGPPPVRSYDWSGLYLGGQAGYANADFGFGGSTQSLAANIVRTLRVESEAGISRLANPPGKDARGGAYGAFMGYNWQWGDVILGLEGNYNHTSISATSLDSIGRSFVASDQFRNDVIIDAFATATVKDYATMRARAGYAWDWVMPYAMAGLAIGVVDYSRGTRVRVLETDVSSRVPPRDGGFLDQTDAETRNNAIAYGYMVGGGIDLGIAANFFVRGEYEFVQFNKVGGIPITLNTFRAAAALKF